MIVLFFVLCIVLCIFKISVETAKVFSERINRDSCVIKLGQKLSSCRNRIVFFSQLSNCTYVTVYGC
jgi:hypothetical protein